MDTIRRFTHACAVFGASMLALASAAAAFPDVAEPAVALLKVLP